MQALAPLDELVAVLDWELSDAEKADAADALEYLSDLARELGRPWPDAAHAPRIVCSTVRRAAKRYMSNAEGLTQSRAGDETLGWDGIGDKAGTPYFTETERKIIRGAAGSTSLASVGVYAWGSGLKRPDDGLVPVEDGSKPFPLFDPEEDFG